MIPQPTDGAFDLFSSPLILGLIVLHLGLVVVFVIAGCRQPSAEQEWAAKAESSKAD